MRAARCMLNQAMQLMDRIDDPTVPLHPPAPTESNTSEQLPQTSILVEDDGDQRYYFS